MSDKQFFLAGDIPNMAVKGKRTRKRLEPRDLVGKPAISVDAQPAIGSDQDDAAQEAAPFTFSMNDLIAEVAQLEYLAAIEARSQFEAEIFREAEALLRGSIQRTLIERGLDLLQEQAIFSRAVNKIGAFPEARENFARLQWLPIGLHSRAARLWYCECLAERVVPEAIQEILFEAEAKAAEGQMA